jgi:hypothetical protein
LKEYIGYHVKRATSSIGWEVAREKAEGMDEKTMMVQLGDILSVGTHQKAGP